MEMGDGDQHTRVRTCHLSPSLFIHPREGEEILPFKELLTLALKCPNCPWLREGKSSRMDTGPPLDDLGQVTASLWAPALVSVK